MHCTGSSQPKNSSAARPRVTWFVSSRCHPPKGAWDWIKSEERSSKDKKVYSQLGISIKDCYPSRRIQKMYHHLWHEGSLSASGSKQNGLIMCKMGDHLHTTIIISISILRHMFFSKWESKNEYFALSLWEWHRLSLCLNIPVSPHYDEFCRIRNLPTVASPATRANL